MIVAGLLGEEALQIRDFRGPAATLQTGFIIKNDRKTAKEVNKFGIRKLSYDVKGVLF